MFFIKKIWLLLSFLIFNLTVLSQNESLLYAASHHHSSNIVNSPVLKIDSIAHSSGIASHFSKIYSQSMTNISEQLQTMDSSSQQFIKKFEFTFANYFVNAFLDYEKGTLTETSAWKCYFSNSTAQPWQFVLLGVNAHINTDMWRSLVYNFSQKEIYQHKKKFLVCQSSVAKTYRQFFETLLIESGYLRFIDSFMKGLPKKLGQMIVYKWRRRNVNLAILYYHDPTKFNRKWAKVKKKKERIDALILNHRSKLS